MTVRWGFAGAGAIARSSLAPAVHAAEGARLVAVASRSAERAAALEPERVHSTYAALMRDPDVDAVYVCLANDAHRPWTLAALAAGKHVLCEKPLGLSAAEVDEMAAAAQAAGRLLVEAFWYRWHPRVRLAEQLAVDGALGAVRHVDTGFTFAGVPVGNYRLDPRRGGGALYDVGCYAVSAVLWAFGWAAPSAVEATLRRGPTGVDLDANVTLRFAAGTAQVRAGMAGPEAQWLVVEGDDGRLELPDRPFTASRDDPTELIVSNGSGAARRIPVPPADPYRLMVEAVSAAIVGRAAFVPPLEQSRAVAAVLDAALRTG